ncbi:hypothetical protein QF032_001377 [Streptomyces achromogenes]|uniref:hypothetical protein n=1 Tax=Streptomyces achromogenes TaxID=67255 RepID=UPI002789C245|nr:hypothetical protein [Streptomyces achromogenes]MDQ0829533.1 hypothetical protein [Streptomyces achromogenes]
MPNWVKTTSNSGGRINLDQTFSLLITGSTTFSVTARAVDGSAGVVAQDLSSVQAAEDFIDNLLLNGS